MKKIFNAPLCEYSGFHCGGNAKVLIVIENKNELTEIIDILKRENEKWYVLGKGYNTLISDRGVDGAVLRLEGEFSRIEIFGNCIRVGGGTGLPELLKVSAASELSGLEFLAGIPGTTGAAVVNNCGTKERTVSDLIDEIEIYDTENCVFKSLKNEKIGFGYRNSNLTRSDIVTEVFFKLKSGSKTDIITSIKQQIELKSKSQPVASKSCGCIFKNPEDGQFPAAKLIQMAGLSGASVGDARVSEKHVNFIVNDGNATADDIWKLIRKVKNAVLEQHGKNLELEIDLLGEEFEDS